MRLTALLLVASLIPIAACNGEPKPLTEPGVYSVAHGRPFGPKCAKTGAGEGRNTIKVVCSNTAVRISLEEGRHIQSPQNAGLVIDYTPYGKGRFSLSFTTQTSAVFVAVSLSAYEIVEPTTEKTADGKVTIAEGEILWVHLYKK